MRQFETPLHFYHTPAGQVSPGLAALHALCDAQEKIRTQPARPQPYAKHVGPNAPGIDLGKHAFDFLRAYHRQFHGG